MAKTAPTTKKTAVKKVAKASAKTVKGAATTKATKAKTEKPASGKFIGKTSGLRVMEFQDKLMKENYKAKKTDAQLAKEMRAEFPQAAAFNEAHVAGIRSQWNNGKRASQEGAVPAKRLGKFDEEGNEVNPRAGRKAKADKAAPAKKAKKTAPPPADDEDEDEDPADDGDDSEDDEDDEDVDDEE